MSASPANATLGLIDSVTPGAREAGEHPPSKAPQREALQALLAFSSLHAQIRERRAQEARRGRRRSPDDGWKLEQFVLDEVLQLVAERALAITGCDGVAIALAEGDAIICRGSAGKIAPDAGVRLDPNSGFSGACLRTGRIVRCDDAENDPQVDLQAAKRLGARSMVAVPLMGQRCAVGLFEAFSYDAYGFNDSDVRNLRLLAELILAALRPEEEDRLAEISRRVVTQVAELPDITNAPEPEQSEEPSAGAVPGQHETFSMPPAPAIPSTYQESSTPGMMVVAAVVLLAVALGTGLWWKMRRSADVVDASAPAVVPAVPAQRIPTPTDISLPAPEESHTDSAIQEKLSVLPQVTGIRQWSSAGSSTVVIDLQDQVQYEAHRLSDPERIYFDLHDTALAPGLFGKTIEVGEAQLVRVRMAQPMPGVTRVVLETRGGSNFSVSLEENPYRLVVEVRGRGSSAQPKARVDLFASVPPSPAQRLTPPADSQESARLHPARFRIVLDAGHGGWDLGTVGQQGLMEKDLTLDIVERLGSLLDKRLGADVVYTREGDTYVALEKRTEVANLAAADFFVSVHANYSDLPTARGVETYYTDTFSSVHAYRRDSETPIPALQSVSFARLDIREKVQQSHRLAASVQKALFAALAVNNPGIRNRGVKEAPYVVLTGTSMPAILAEVSFVSSPTDETELQSSTYRQDIAEALYKGIARYASDRRKAKIASASAKATGR